jgi:hypothetical protein
MEDSQKKERGNCSCELVEKEGRKRDNCSWKKKKPQALRQEQLQLYKIGVEARKGGRNEGPGGEVNKGEASNWQNWRVSQDAAPVIDSPGRKNATLEMKGHGGLPYAFGLKQSP